MANAGIIQAELSVNVGTAIAEIRKAVAALEQLGKSGSLVNPANAGLSGFEQGIKKLAQEQRSGARVANFYAQQIGELGNVGNAAQRTISGIIQTMSEMSNFSKGITLGGTFLVAVEAASLFVGIVRGINEENEKWAKTQREVTDGVVKSNRALQEVATTQRETRAESIFRSQEDSANSSIREQLEEINKISRELATARGPQWDLELKLQSLQERIQPVKLQLDGLRQVMEETKAIELSKMDREIIDAGTSLDSKISLARMGAHEILRANEDLAAKLREIARDVTHDDLQKIQLRKNAHKEAALVIAKAYRDAYESTLTAGAMRHRGAMEDTGLGAEVPPGFLSVEQWQEQVRQAEIARQATQTINEGFMQGWQAGELPDLINSDKIKPSVSIWEQVADAVDAAGSAFSGLGAAIGGVAGEMVSKMIDVMVAAVKMAIALAAAANAPLGPLGWINAIGAAVTLAATMASVLAGVQPRAAGGPVRSGQPYLVGERGPEIVVPGQSGYVIPNHQVKQGAATGPSISFHISAMDGKDVYRTLTNARGDVARFLREFSRDGRG